MLPLTFWQLIIGQKIILSNIIRIIRRWRRKVKNKTTKARPKAMHQGMIFQTFSLSFTFWFLWMFTLSSLVDHLCARLPYAFTESAPLPRMTLPLFNSHTLIFVPFLRHTSDSWACLAIRHKMYVADHKKKSHLSLWQCCLWLITLLVISDPSKVLWPCLTSCCCCCCIAPFYQPTNSGFNFGITVVFSCDMPDTMPVILYLYYACKFIWHQYYKSLWILLY